MLVRRNETSADPVVGYKLATLAAKVYLIMLLQKLDVEVRDHDHKVRLGALLEMTKPVAIRVTHRD